MAPLHALSILIVLRTMLSRRYGGWLRLVATAALGLHAPAPFFLYSERYYLLAWLLTLLVCCAFVRDEAWPWLARRFPVQVKRLQEKPALGWLGVRLALIERDASALPARRAISAA
jgi:hypothetical protein